MDRARPVPSKNIPLAVLALSVSLLAALATGGSARASQLVDRNAHNVHLQVNARGQALITYRAAGRLRRVLGWGAINARPSSSAGKQVSFRLDYSGGWGTYHRRLWQAFPDTCHRYDGPTLTHVVASCTAGDGSYWALQSWQLALPDLGFAPWLPAQKVPWLTLSHWSGPIAELEAHTDWVYGGRFQQVFGRLNVPRPASLRLRNDAPGSADGPVRPADLPRHSRRAQVRDGLAPGELFRHPQRNRGLLLRLLPARSDRRRLRRAAQLAAASSPRSRCRQALPPDRSRPRCHA